MTAKRGRPKTAHGTTFARKGRSTWYFSLALEQADGSKQWLAPQNSGIALGATEAEHKRSRKKAEDVRRKTQNTLNASREVFETSGAGVTVAQLIQRYGTERQKQNIVTWQSELQRLTDYVLPELGELPVIDVRPRHIIAAYESIRVKTYRTGKLISQKTLDETHRTLTALFDFASVLDVIPHAENPTKPVIPAYRRSSATKDPRRRNANSYTLEEVATLISHPAISLYWRCLFGVESLAMTRAMEAGRLRFGDWTPSLENLNAPVGQRTLGELRVIDWKNRWRNSDAKKYVPVHPALAALLAEWRLHGFFDAFGRQPTPDDTMFPYIRKPGSRKEHGSAVTSKVIWKELQNTLARLELMAGLATRAQHGLRRAGSSALADAGVSPHDRKRITHKPDLSNMQERYDAPSWQRLSEAMLKLELPKLQPPKVLEMPRRVVGGEEGQGVTEAYQELFCHSSASDTKPTEVVEDSTWRRRESNPSPVSSESGRERKRAPSKSESVRRVVSLPAPSILEPPASGRTNTDNARVLLDEALKALQNSRELPAVTVRVQATRALRAALPLLEGRAAFLVETAVEELASVAPGARSFRETIVAKALVSRALQEVARV